MDLTVERHTHMLFFYFYDKATKTEDSILTLEGKIQPSDPKFIIHSTITAPLTNFLHTDVIIWMLNKQTLMA